MHVDSLFRAVATAGCPKDLHQQPLGLHRSPCGMYLVKSSPGQKYGISQPLIISQLCRIIVQPLE